MATPTVTVDNQSFAKPWELLRNNLANSAKFQEVVGAEDAAEAKEKIIYFWADEEDSDHAKPRAVIRGLDDEENERESIGSWSHSGPIVLYFEFPVPSAYQSNHQDAGLDFLNKLGIIRYQMQDFARSNPDSSPSITIIRLAIHGQADLDQNSGEQWWGGEVIVEWTGQ